MLDRRWRKGVEQGLVTQEQCPRLVDLASIYERPAPEAVVAAGLVKPTTGGGIHYSILSAGLAADVAVGTTVNKSITVYDSIGKVHTLAVAFTKTADNAWSAAATLDGTATTSDSDYVAKTGTRALIKDGVASDELVPPIVFKEGKRERVRELLAPLILARNP